jgi:hypothetical protein
MAELESAHDANEWINRKAGQSVHGVFRRMKSYQVTGLWRRSEVEAVMDVPVQ